MEICRMKLIDALSAWNRIQEEKRVLHFSLEAVWAENAFIQLEILKPWISLAAHILPEKERS